MAKKEKEHENFFKNDSELFAIANRLVQGELSEYGRQHFKEPISLGKVMSHSDYLKGQKQAQ